MAGLTRASVNYMITFNIKCMTEEPFIHKSAFYDVKTNFEYHKKIIQVF